LELLKSSAKKEKEDVIEKKELSVKECLEQFAVENAVVFIPTGRTRGDGKPLYKFGNQWIVFEKDIIYVKEKNGNWKPASMSDLLARIQGLD